MRFDDIRQDYRGGPLSETTWPANPFAPLKAWLQQAIEAGIREANAMTLATADAHGRPSARTVLLKHFEAERIGFVSNYESRKGRQIAENPQAALVLYWQSLERQVRLEGPLETAPPALSDALFAARPRAAQIGAWASPQSETICDRGELERRVQETDLRFPNEVQRPPHWGAYLMKPILVEFWQGAPNRLHDRLCHTRREDDTWHVRRLAP